MPSCRSSMPFLYDEEAARLREEYLQYLAMPGQKAAE